MQYDAKLKAEVLAHWKAGDSASKLASRHDIPLTTVRRWTKGHERVAVLAAPKKETVAEYDLDKMAVALIDGSVSAFRSILGVTADDAWLKKQDADKLGVLAGIIADKLYRLLGALKYESPDPNP